MPRPSVDRDTASGPTPLVHFRVPPETTASAGAQAARDGLTLSAAVRELMRLYGAGEIRLPAQVTG